MTQRWVDEDISSSYYFSFITFLFFSSFLLIIFSDNAQVAAHYKQTMQSFQIHVCVLYIIIFIEILSNHNHFRRKKGNS